MKYESIRDEKARRGAHINTKVASYEALINFTAVEKGLYNICFHNRGNVAEAVKFEIIHRESGVADHQEPARDGECLNTLNTRVLFLVKETLSK